MRLHILPDQKIIDRTIETFENVFPGENRYIVISPGNIPKYVDIRKKNVYHFKSAKDQKFWKVVGDVSVYSSIILHSLTSNAVYFINRINHPSIYWIEWGHDLYNNLLAPRGFEQYYDYLSIERYIYKSKLSRFLHRYCRFLYPRKSIKQAISKVHYFVPDSMYDEYPLLLSYYPQYKHLVYKEFFYYPIDQVINMELRNERCHGSNIVVGNSCSFTGNHKEIIILLSQLGLKNREIKFPINYAGSDEYRNYVIKTGSDLLGECFKPLTKFMSLEEYNKYLLNASYFIYNNYRQEAVGNILVALYIGGKVFLSDHSPLLTFYQKMGLIIFPVSDISIESLSKPMENEDVETNRAIIERVYSLERLYSLVEQNFV